MKISTHECFFLLTFQSGQILREASLLSERSNGRELLLLNKQRTDPGSQPPSASKAMGPHREPTEMVERGRLIPCIHTIALAMGRFVLYGSSLWQKRLCTVLLCTGIFSDY